MKKVVRLVLVMLMCCGIAYAEDQDEINKYFRQLHHLSDSQLKIMVFSYKMGVEFDLGYSLAAIAWKESNFGLYLMNLADGKLGSFGVYHILLEYAIARNKIKSNWDISRYAERLVFDNELCANEAISELLFWKKYHKKHANVWRRMFASYNAGTFGIDTEKGRIYAEDAVNRVRALERFFKKKKILDKLK